MIRLCRLLRNIFQIVTFLFAALYLVHVLIPYLIYAPKRDHGSSTSSQQQLIDKRNSTLQPGKPDITIVHTDSKANLSKLHSEEHQKEELRDLHKEGLSELQTEELRDIHKEALSEHQKEELRVLTENTAAQKCERKIDLVYIKTHKTGSCTVTNLLYRNALNHNIDTLLFTYFPYPWDNIAGFFLHERKWIWKDHNLEVPSKFHLAAEHMRYERSEFDKVMHGTPLYVSTLRRPLDHLRSMFNYFGLAKRLGINSTHSDPAEELIRNFDKYPKEQLQGVYRVDNRNANMFGFPEEFMHNPKEIERFIEKMSSEFKMMMITEYMSESFVLLRRKMCWDLIDMLYASINVRNYKFKKEPDPELIKLHKTFNMVDYMLYDHFNQTLWKQIGEEGEDFWDEMDVYETYQEMSGKYCDQVYSEMKKNMSSIYHLHKTMKPLVLPETKWGPEGKIDPVWCLVSRIDIMPFYNILRVKQYPQICDHIKPVTDMYRFRLDNKKKTIEINPQFCTKNPENLMAPLDLLATGRMYMWA